MSHVQLKVCLVCFYYYHKLYITKTSLFKYTETLTTKNWKLSDKKSDIFHIFAQNIDCGYSLEPPRRGGSNEYPQSMFLSRNKKNNVYTCKPQWDLRGSKLYRRVFVMEVPLLTANSVDPDQTPSDFALHCLPMPQT